MGETGDGRLADDIAQLENITARLKSRLAGQIALRLVPGTDGPSYASQARTLLEARKRLQRFLPGDYFSDPAFDMLLDLFVAAEAGESRSFKASAIASRVPAATAARYVDLMVRDGIVLRRTDPQDGRRTLLSLSDLAVASLRDWLASVPPIPLRP
ncbi:MAG: hypothetical protein ABW173_10620 [Sphingomonas sp.]